MVKSMADELNSDASELIRAASIPHTTIPFTPAGNSFDTKVGKAASALCIPLANMGRKPSPPATSDFWCKGKSDHARNKEKENRQQFEIRAEYRSSPRLFLVLSREDTLHDKLVGTPIPETDNRRTDKCTQPRKVGIPVIAYEIGHGITVIVDGYVAANAHHLIPTAQFFKSENQDDKRSEKKYRRLQYRGVEYRFHTPKIV